MDGEAEQIEEAPAFEDDSSPEDVAEAKALGWKDPSEWKGAPPKNGFVKASDYVERGKTIVPIIRSQNAKLEKDLAASNKRLEDFKAEQTKTFENLSRMSKAALDRQRTQLEEKYSASIDAATEVGDKAEVQRLRKEEKEAFKEFDKAADEPPKQDVTKAKDGELPPEARETITKWTAANSWYETDEDMQAVANRRHAKLLSNHPNWSLEKNLDETAKYVAKRFPSEFPDAKKDDDEDDDDKPARSRVEGGARLGGASGGSKFNKLPAEAKAQADRFIKEDGLFLEKGETVEKDINKARERYAAQYGDTK